MNTLCLGEAIVDLMCERPVDHFGQADSFVPHLGGTAANAALVASRCGAKVMLAGGVGDDHWGAWLERRLSGESIDLRWFSRIAGLATPLAFVAVDSRGRPEFAVYGQGIEATIRSLDDRLEAAIASCDALLFGSNTLVGETERRVTLRARKLALEQGKPVVFDANLRLHRWPDRNQAVELARSVCSSARLVKANQEEAALLGGRPDPRRAGKAIVDLGADAVVVTLGADGALATGTVETTVPGVAARALDTTGAGDVVTGVLIAALATRGFDLSAAADALPAAVEAAARSTEGWGAIDTLPEPMPQ